MNTRQRIEAIEVVYEISMKLLQVKSAGNSDIFHWLFVWRWTMEKGIMKNATNKSATAMLTNMELVSDRTSGFLHTM